MNWPSKRPRSAAIRLALLRGALDGFSAPVVISELTANGIERSRALGGPPEPCDHAGIGLERLRALDPWPTSKGRIRLLEGLPFFPPGISLGTYISLTVEFLDSGVGAK